MKKHFSTIKILALLTVFSLGISYAYAAFYTFYDPSSTPSTTNPPVHTGTTQVKQGGLSLNEFEARSSVAFNGGPTSVWFGDFIRGVDANNPTTAQAISRVRFGGSNGADTYDTSIVANGNIRTKTNFSVTSLDRDAVSRLCADSTGKVVTCIASAGQPQSVTGEASYVAPTPENITYTNNTVTPPQGFNTPPPVDVGSVSQHKEGLLTVDSFVASLGAWLKGEVWVAGGVFAASPSNPTSNIYFGDASGGVVTVDVSGDIASRTLQAKNLENTAMRHVCADANGALVLCATEPADACPNIPGYQDSIPEHYALDASGNCAKVIKGTVTITWDDTYSRWARNSSDNAWLGTGYAIYIKVTSVEGVPTSTWNGPDITFNWGSCRSPNSNYSGPNTSVIPPKCYPFAPNYIGSTTLPYPKEISSNGSTWNYDSQSYQGIVFSDGSPQNAIKRGFLATIPSIPTRVVDAESYPSWSSTRTDIDHYQFSKNLAQVDVYNIVNPPGYVLKLDPIGLNYKGNFQYTVTAGEVYKARINSISQFGTVPVKQYP